MPKYGGKSFKPVSKRYKPFKPQPKPVAPTPKPVGVPEMPIGGGIPKPPFKQPPLSKKPPLKPPIGTPKPITPKAMAPKRRTPAPFGGGYPVPGVPVKPQPIGKPKGVMPIKPQPVSGQAQFSKPPMGLPPGFVQQQLARLRAMGGRSFGGGIRRRMPW